MKYATPGARRVLLTVSALSFAAVASIDSASAGPSVGHWSRPADMSVPRYMHQAVALDDGRVLVAGGYRAEPSGLDVTAAAEVVDPVAGTSTPVPPMAHPRAEFAAAELADGRVLVAGGQTLDSPNFSAEVFDPSSNQWRRTADVPFGNASRAAVLGNGAVLVFGGWESYAAASYNPTTDAWSMVTLPSALTVNNNSVHSLVALADGTALAISVNGATATYNPFTASWTTAGSVEARRETVAVRTLDGKVLMLGGADATRSRTSTWVYDPIARTWAAGPALSHPRVAAVAAVLPDGAVLVAGGYDTAQGPVASAELLAMDDLGQGWQPAGAMQVPRYGAAAVTTRGGDIVISGGHDGGFATKAVEVFGNSDQQPPTITGAPDRVPDVYGWYIDPVTVTFTCSDEGSGVAACSEPVTLNTEGRDQSATGTAVDRSGNTSTTTVGPIGIDFTAPTTTIDTPAVTLVARPVVNGSLSGTASDTVSGVLGVRVLLWSQADGTLYREFIAPPANCTAHGLACQWSVAIPNDMAPGVYDVTAQAADFASHVDPFGATTRLVLVR